ncbi:sigma-70 family RNA polymerase sigma factor [bacterium]|nr:sigma-70 family RNA polymerase sigma factor [bacterium]
MNLNWNHIIDDIGPRLFRYFSFRCSDMAADDLTQETLLRLFRKVKESRFDPAKGSLVMLAFGIAHYVALEYRREPTVEIQSEFDDEFAQSSDVNQEHSLISKDIAIYVRKHIEKLSPGEQQVLALLIDESLKMSEIALVLNIPENTVKSQLMRAKKKLVSLIQKEVLL